MSKAKSKKDLASIAAGIADQLDALEPADVQKVLDIVDTLRTKPEAKMTAAPNLSPPSKPPSRIDGYWPPRPGAQHRS